MASSGTFLTNEDPETSTESTFTWSIQNFSHCTLKEDEYLDSPEFKFDLFCDNFHLRLFPRGYKNTGTISFYLGNDENIGCDFEFALSIRCVTGQFKEAREEENYTDWYSAENCGYFGDCLKLNDTEDYLDNDTLTLRCRIWEEDNDGEQEHFYAHTKIKATKVNYTWTLSDIQVTNQACEYKFQKFTEVKIFKSEIPKLKLHVLNGGSCGEDAIHFGIEMPSLKKAGFMNYVVYVLDADACAIHATSGKCSFTSWKTKHIFPLLTKRKLYLNEQLYIPNGELTLRSKLSFSSNNELEIIEYGRTKHLHPKSAKSNQLLDGHVIWKENLSHFYEEEKLSDVSVYTPNRKYPVHRAIICAHSKVFRAMFAYDTKERQTGEIKIEDMEDDTVSQMLKFLYTNTLAEIDSSTLQKLLYAADKYGIEALRVICSNRLKQCLDISNVCHVLALADLHRDEELKSSAKDFIATHARYILKSEEWKEVKESNAQLIFETMEWLICNNFPKIEV